MLPAPSAVHPFPGQKQVVLLRPSIRSALIEVGEFTYYADLDAVTEFETRNILYHCGPEKLRIGQF